MNISGAVAGEAQMVGGAGCIQTPEVTTPLARTISLKTAPLAKDEERHG